MPIETRLAAAPAARLRPLASFLSDVAAGAAEMPDLVVTPVASAQSQGLASFLGGEAADLISALRVTNRAGEFGQIPCWPSGAGRPGPVGRLLLIGLGDESPAELRAAGAAVARQADAQATVVVSGFEDKPAGAVRAFAEGALLGGYRFALKGLAAGADVADRPGPPTRPAPAEIRLLTADPRSCQSALDRAAVVAGAVALARDLANTPADRKTPDWLADRAVAVAAVSGLAARVWDEAMLAADGFGGLLGVGAGSARPPRLIQLSHVPPGWREHVVLVGKGVTFDSGGLSLKPNEGMALMKTDMAGGAAVIAVMSALGRLGVPARVTGLVAAAENMPSGSALHPGDILSIYGGRTVEVLNTDAEGRLVLADALAYADSVLRPDTMVDLATLTGAARVALGARTGALYASDDGLASGLLTASAASGDALWRMPLADDYREGLDSPVADLRNVARGDRQRAGSIDGALFLREFAGGRPWAHLDIAGSARSAADDGEISKGATGFGVRVLLEWLAPAGDAAPGGI